MKKIILIICALVLTSFARNDNQDLKAMLIAGKWFIESTQESGQEPEMSANKTDEWILFHSDGKVEEGIFGDVVSGSWEIAPDNKSIKITGSENAIKRIVEVSNSKLIVEAFGDVNDTGDILMVTYIK